MHPNQAFRSETTQQNMDFARARGFGILSVNGTYGPLVSHVPFKISADASEVELHLVRSNPILRELKTPQPAVIAVSGGDAYISPDWYGVADQVPTWNYVAVHLRGELSILPHEEMHDVLAGLSEVMESRLAPKKNWTSDKMDQAVYQRMLRQIVPIRLQITEVTGTWKLSQNKPDAVRIAAANGLEETGFGQEVPSIIAAMRKVPPQD